MVNSFDQNVRSALETRLATVAGLPAIAYEGVRYTPVPGTPFVEPTIVPISERPVTMGDGHLVLHEGIFMVVLVYPNGKGSGAIEAMANAVKSKFKASDTENVNSVIVRFRYAERLPSVHQSDWIRVPVAIGFYLHDTDY